MILTRMFINTRRRGARHLLTSPQVMHAAILAGFPPGRETGRVLWRLDGVGTRQTTLWIVSPSEPDLTHLEEQAGWPTQPTFRSVDYEGLLRGLAPGQRWAFRLTANPAHRGQHEGRSKVFAHVTATQQTQWLLDRQARLGIALAEGKTPTFGVVNRETRSFRRDRSTVTLGMATYSGVLRVEDPQALRTALVSGVGRAKAYGCGLLTLARP